jgi:hypothetical protein
MPKYNVSIDQVIITTYDVVEVEAETSDDAIRIAEEMARDEELGEDSSTSEYQSTATIVT